MASSDKRYITGLNLHEIFKKILLEYTADFEFFGSMGIGAVKNKQTLDSGIWVISKFK